MNLGDRIKNYEKSFRQCAVHRMPLMIRVDGRAFHTFTRGCKRPFDTTLMSAMVKAAHEVARDMQGFKAAYIQSDEATFCLTDYDDINTSGWFDYELPKVISISAALMTAHFNKFYPNDKCPVFDSRAFSVPADDVVNAFLWRAKDWERNSLQMYARSFFSHKDLHGKKKEDIHEMLHGIGKNWTIDLKPVMRNGTFIRKGATGTLETNFNVKPTYADVNKAIGHLF